MLKNVVEVNKINENKAFLKELFATLKNIDEKKVKLDSVIIFVEYSETATSDITYLLNGKNEKNKNLNLGLLKFRTALTRVVKKYIETEEVQANIYIGYNYSEEDFEKYKNLRKGNQVKNLRNELDIKPETPKFSFDNMILNKTVEVELNKVLLLLKNKNKIYSVWGFDEIEPTPRCIINFYGASGTGKTMAAHAITNELNKKILLLNYSDIESKYVGEAPKNLIESFRLAKESDSVLFFDEADSFLGARIKNVQQSSDQAINSLRSQMLIQLEAFNGIVIFATNLIGNYDKAFDSRILHNIEFSLPDENMRIKLIKKMIPQKAPVDKNVFDYDFLKELGKIIDGFSPREIKNTMLETLANAVYENLETISQSIFEKTFRNAALSKNRIGNIKNIQKQTLSSELFADKVREGIESGNYVAYKASDLLEEK